MKIEVRGLTKTFGSATAVGGVSFVVNEGELLGLLGPSGSGKTTVLRLIAGLEVPTAGDIFIDGKRVNDLTVQKRNIGFVFQHYALFPHMSVFENVAFGLSIRPRETRPAKADIARRVIELLDLVQMGPYGDRYPAQLSGGQRQRVAMGRALVRDPKLFLFDEPLSNLDAKLRVDMRTEIKRLHQRMKTTIVYVTHDQIEAMTLATKIAVLKDGVLQQFGSPAEIYNNPANMFVADFMGSPAMNLLKAKVENNGSGLAVSLARHQAEPLVLSVPNAPDSLSAYNGKDVIFGIRPEALTDPDGADRNARTVAEGDCLIEVVEPAGADTFAVTHLGGKEIVARLRADVRIAAGQIARLAFNLDKAVFFDPASQLRIA